MSSFSVTVAAPPSKSFSHRKLVAASLAKGTSHLTHVLESDDTFRTMDVLSRTGTSIMQTAPGEYAVMGVGQPPQGGYETAAPCFMGESGTSCRLLTAVLAAGNGAFLIDGDPRLRVRPMGDLLTALSALGVNISYAQSRGFLPLTIATRGLTQVGKDSWLPVQGEISSQFLSGLLLAAPLARHGLGILLAGETSVSWPYVGLTLQTLEDAGCRFTVETLQDKVWTESNWRNMRTAHPGATRFRVKAGKYRPLKGKAAIVEGDYTGASYLLAAGAIGRNPVTVTNLNQDSVQGDRAILDILTAMGASVLWNGGRVTVKPACLRGIDRYMGDCPDLVPTVAVLACFATGPTILRGIRHLSAKESDRLQAPAMELVKTGSQIRVTKDTLTIIPLSAIPEDPILFSAHNDHRMAMSLALLELAGINAALDNPACVSKSFPGFWKTWSEINPDTRIARS